MFLDRRNPAYPLIVCECFIVGGNQADNLGFSTVAQDLDT